jgi:diaminopimelate epimerase
MKVKMSDVIHFYKLSGAGNHFVLLDVRDGYPRMRRGTLVRTLCMNAFSIGADGVLFVEQSSDAHFRVLYYNADGFEASMCGNGIRCAARFAHQNRIAPASMRIETACGIVRAHVKSRSVEVGMGRPTGLKRDVSVSTTFGSMSGDVVNTGVPHFVTRVTAFEWRGLDVETLGRAIRRHRTFRPDGVNVDFVRVCSEGPVQLRTYERGVEAETLACGTGAVAAAFCLAERGLVKSPVRLLTRGGDVLTARLHGSATALSNIWLVGPAQVVYEGHVRLSVLKEISKRSGSSR